MKRILALLLVLCLCFSVFGCSKTSKYGQGFRFPMKSEPEQLDPQVASDSASVEILSAISEGLTRLDENGAVIAGLASTWKVSEDGLTYTFVLKEGLKWSDGSPLTAADFVFAWQRVVDPGTYSTLTDSFIGIAHADAIIKGKENPEKLGVEALSDTKLQVSLTSPDAGFPARVSELPFAPCNQEFFLKSKGHYGLETEYVLCSGPFTVSAWSHGEYCILSKNEQYVDASSVLPSKVRYVIGSEENPYDLLVEGGLQAGPIKPEEIKLAERKQMSTVTMNDSICCLWMNTKADGLQKAETRRALRSAMNEEKILEIISKYGLPQAKGFFPEGIQWKGKPYRTTENALSMQGDRMKPAAMQKACQDLPSLTVLCEDDEVSVALAQAAIQSWQKNLDVYFKLETTDAATLEWDLRNGEYDLAIGTQMAIGESIEDAVSMFDGNGEYNLASLNSATYKTALIKAEKSGKQEDYESAERLLQNLCPCVPLYTVNRTYALAKGVENVVIRPFDGGGKRAVYDFRYATRED